MPIDAAIYTRLTTDSTVSAIVGTRVHQIRMPDNTPLPAISYQVVGGEPVESFTGYSGLISSVFAIDCWASSAGVVKDLARKVHLSLHGHSGTYGDTTIENVLEWSFYDLFDSDTEIYHVSCSARFWYY